MNPAILAAIMMMNSSSVYRSSHSRTRYESANKAEQPVQIGQTVPEFDYILIKTTKDIEQRIKKIRSLCANYTPSIYTDTYGSFTSIWIDFNKNDYVTRHIPKMIMFSLVMEEFSDQLLDPKDILDNLKAKQKEDETQ